MSRANSMKGAMPWHYALIVMLLATACDKPQQSYSLEPYKVIARLNLDVKDINVYMPTANLKNNLQDIELLNKTVSKHFRERFLASGFSGSLEVNILDTYLTTKDAGTYIRLTFEGVIDYDDWEKIININKINNYTINSASIVDDIEAQLQQATGTILYSEIESIILPPK